MIKLDDDTCKYPGLFGYIEYCVDCEGVVFEDGGAICIEKDIVDIDNCVVGFANGCKVCDFGYQTYESEDGIIRC